jgi:hypothetical protein
MDEIESPMQTQSSRSSVSSNGSLEAEKSLAPKVGRRPNPKSGLKRGILYIHDHLVSMRIWCLRRIAGMDLHPSVRASLRANLDLTNPRGVHIGEGTYLAFHAVVLAHDMSRLLHTDTYIGRNCFIGAYSIIMPGIRVGDECIVGSGSVVTKDVSSHSIVGGNPARVLQAGIRTRKWGILEESYARVLALEKDGHPEDSAGT